VTDRFIGPGDLSDPEVDSLALVRSLVERRTTAHALSIVDLDLLAASAQRLVVDHLVDDGWTEDDAYATVSRTDGELSAEIVGGTLLIEMGFRRHPRQIVLSFPAAA
jgi:hypothetical protein